jgi:response regulator RpfG family c-di-GMP phosphodiesterase
MDRLLFVDDEPFVLRALKRTFEMEGFEVVTASHPAEALATLKAGKEFQVIGSDYRMPDMNGAEFLQQAREIAPQSYRLLISAVEEFGAAVDAINRGEIQRLVPKPWDRDELVAIIRSAVEDYHLRRRYSEMTALLHTKNAALESMNRELEQRVHASTAGLVTALVSALDQRGAESVHSRRAALWCRRLGEQLGLLPGEVNTLERAAMLHDVGKVGVPDAVLAKRSALNEAEWAQMRRHPEIGYRLLGGVPFLSEARKIVLQHHERFDGEGYPLRLAGPQILRGARIFHLVEAYDAILEPRTYHVARNDDQAREEIARCSGTQFDPEVVAAFQAIPRAEWAEIPSKLAGPATEEDPPLEELRRRATAGTL